MEKYRVDKWEHHLNYYGERYILYSQYESETGYVRVTGLWSESRQSWLPTLDHLYRDGKQAIIAHHKVIDAWLTMEEPTE